MKIKKTKTPCRAKSQSAIDGIPVHCAHDSCVEIGKLTAYPKNNKNHPDDQIDMLVKAIRAHGWRAPITVSNQSGYIVRGHARLLAALRMGLKHVPVDYQDYANEEAERMDRIADNRLAELAEWDLPALKEELLELDTGSVDMELTGFDEKALKIFLTPCDIAVLNFRVAIANYHPPIF